MTQDGIEQAGEVAIQIVLADGIDDLDTLFFRPDNAAGTQHLVVMRDGGRRRIAAAGFAAAHAIAGQ